MSESRHESAPDVPARLQLQLDDIAEEAWQKGPPEIVPEPLLQRVSLDERQRRRVVVTGMGALSPLGLTVGQLWEGLVAGRSGIGPLTHCDPTGYPTQVAGEIKDFDYRRYMDHKEGRRMARFSQIAVAATRMAIEDAGIDLEHEDRDRVGVVLGNGNGGFPVIDQEMRTIVERGGSRVNPLFFPMVLPNMAASQVSILFGITGHNSTIVTACAAATQALGEAVEMIRYGRLEVALSGGTEAGISELGLAGFSAIRAMTSRNDPPEAASRPFDALRDGFVPAEGAAILVLESLEHALAREANILAEITGYGVSADAFNLVAPDPEGKGAALAMERALRDADLTPEAIGYINAHATSTQVGDAVETAAIKRVFGEHAPRVPISATKSMIGHALGAAGALEAVACIKTILDQVVHPTINYECPDPACDLDYVPNRAREAPVRAVLSNSFGFGGQNACLVFERYGE
jgi:3-oxoacyl-[acyl-carrier-protein] synthase II